MFVCVKQKIENVAQQHDHGELDSHNEVAARGGMTVACLCVEQHIGKAYQQHDHGEIDFQTKMAERG